MKVSLNVIKWQGYKSMFDIAVDQLVEKIGAQLGAVEEVIDLGAKYDGSIVAKVISCKDHPNADRLHVCMIDDGGAADNVERNADGHVQVVCGAPNVREGLLVAWLPPGSTVPSSAGKEPFVLEVRELRGVVSNGMLASPAELAISDNHDGILEIDPSITVLTPEGDRNPAPGMEFKALFGLDDTIIDIENKMFTHRPDCFGLLGVARELAGIQRQPFKSPDWYLNEPNFPEGNGLPLIVRNELPDLVPRFIALTLKDVVVGPSPVWLQSFLQRLGVKSINNIVDVTNYMMLLTGQPLHAYDYDKVKALSENEATIVVRQPKAGEKVSLLNGKEIEPRAEAIMIATDKQLIGVGGVMGGSETEVSATTKNIILECATFDMYSIRKTSMAHGLFTDAVTRFNKGQSPLQNDRVLAQAITMIFELAGGQTASEVIDEAKLLPVQPVTVSMQFINERLGLQLPADMMRDLLVNVEFGVELNGDTLLIKPPFWRTDIEIPEDIVEEIGRLYGYDHLPVVLPKRDISPTVTDSMLELKRALRSRLQTAGANEVLSYSFVHGKLLEKAGQDPSKAFSLSNALSPDLQYYRLSLTPSLLEKVHPNSKAGYDAFALFELGKGHIANAADTPEEPVPMEYNCLALVIAAKKGEAGAPFYQAQYYLNYLIQAFGTAATLTPWTADDIADNDWLNQLAKPYDPARSALIKDDQGTVWGIVGEFTASARKQFKLPATVAGFEVGPVLFTKRSKAAGYVPLPRFPKVEQDICLKVPTTVSYQALADLVENELHQRRGAETYATVAPIDIYAREDDPDYKQITFRVSIASYQKTMTDTEVNSLLDSIAEAAKTALKADRV